MLQKIASNTFSQILSKALTAFISIFLLGLLTKFLPTEWFGQYNKVYNYLAFFAFFADLGLYAISVREIAKDQTQASKIIGSVLTLRLILGVWIVWIAFLLAFFLPGYHSTLMLISIGIVGIFTVLSLLNSSVLSLMQAFMKIEFSLFSVVMGKIINFLGIVWVVYYFSHLSSDSSYFFPFLWILIAGVVGMWVNVSLNYWYAKKIVSIRFWCDWSYIKHLFLISLPYGIALFLSVVYFKIDIILLSILEPTQIADISIALYSVPLKIIEVLMVLGVFFLNSILPVLSKNFSEKNEKSILKVFLWSFRFLFSLSGLIVVFWLLFGTHILSLIATHEYIDHSIYVKNSVDVFWIVIFILAFYFLASLFNYILIASKNESILLKINIFITIVNIIWNLIFIPKYSFMWAAYVTLVSQILLCVLGYISSKKVSNISLDTLYIIKVVILSMAIFLLGQTLLKYASGSLLSQWLLYGSVIWGLYVIGIFFLNKNYIIQLISERETFQQLQ